MIEIKDKQQCCGCASCVQRCPKQCISLKEDQEGFLYPLVDLESCIGCGLCERVCPVQNPYETHEPLQVLAAINKDEKIRMESSSGGIFTLLAKPIIRKGGVVFGACFDEDWQVTLGYTETIEGLASFRGSKYVQARTGNTYKQCEHFLKAGRKVLFTGTPCQIAGLHHYLRKEYDNLITCDLVCHGVPSPKVWRMYLKEVLVGADRAIKDIQFRNKDNGWKAFNFKLAYDEESKIVTLTSCHKENPYMRAFLTDMILRPSCHDCKAKQGRSMADITIADFWGIHKMLPEMDDDKGTGLVIVNSHKGKSALDLLDINSIEVKFENVRNKGLKPSSPMPDKRASFFAKLDETDSLINLIREYTKPNLKQQIKREIKTLLLSVKNLYKPSSGGGNS